MDYSGLIVAYPVNRPLTEEERADQLKQKERSDVDPHYDFSVIRINSTFIESVDKFYAYRGVLTTAMLWGALFFLFAALYPLGQWIGSNEVEFPFFEISIALPVSILPIWLLLKETFTYTHFPIRFNRRNRMVYVFRKDGTVLKENWNRIFFTYERVRTVFGNEWIINGHILDKDRNLVLETFGLPAYGGNEKEVLPVWEFYRRYMEDGEQAALGSLELICLPRLDMKRESFRFGWERLLINNKGGGLLWLVALPIETVCALGRWLSMRTSKIPQWPQWVEDECRVESDDPFVKDRSTNAQDVRAG